MTDRINIKGLNKAEVLAALYNHAKPQGMGFLQYTPEDMTKDQAQKLLDNGDRYFDYVKGRVMKVELSQDYLDPWLYDRDNGQGEAQEALKHLLEKTK